MSLLAKKHMKNAYIRAPVEHCNTAKHIYSSIWFSKDLIRDGTFEAKQKYSAISKKGKGS